MSDPASAQLAALIEPGRPTPLGATCNARGVNFALYSRCAERVELCLYDPESRAERGRVALPGSTLGTWHGCLPASLAKAGDLYAYRVYGPYAPEGGLRCNPQKLLLDPAARALSGEPTAMAPELLDGPGRHELDSAAALPRCRIVDAAFDWGDDRSPGTPWSDTVLYELHVRGFTKLHPGVPERLRGTYLGLAEPAVTGWLRELGITAVELLPVQAHASERFLLERGLGNYWGYNPIAWSAPASQYALADPVSEFRQMVKAMHAAGIEVILDVVFNHSAEGNELGPTLSLRGIDNLAYYRLVPHDRRLYENLTGTGNTIDADVPAVRELILDSLRWWAAEMHVDGFRFDLAPVLGRDRGGFNRNSPFFAALRSDPALAYVKLIAEPWDLGPGGYQLGHFPAGWSEWNDRWRDTVRSFWRGDPRMIGALAERLAGSSDLFRDRGRKPSASVNFVTAHDGFTLRDLVSYNRKHNERNLENNDDGNSDNLSWNCGVEGPSDDPAVNALRNRQMRNLLLTLLVSQGVPMLQAGDEFGRTQRGNNNAYCQDNDISWVDWSRAASEADLVAFTRRLIALRRSRPELRRETFLKGRRRGKVHDVGWLHPSGRDLREADWNDPELRAIGVLIAAAAGSSDGDLLVLLNASALAVEFRLPALAAGSAWIRLIDSGAAADVSGTPGGDAEQLAPRTAVVCNARPLAARPP
jgi:isoamylase